MTTAGWKLLKKCQAEGTEYVWAEVVDSDPAPNQVVPGCFYHPSSYLTKSDGFEKHEWKYMTKNATTVRYEPFR